MRYLIILAISLIVCPSYAESETATDQSEIVRNLDSISFLEVARRSILGNCWVKLEGKLYFRGKDRRIKREKIRCSSEMRQNKIVFKSMIGREQSVKIEQNFTIKDNKRIIDYKILENYTGSDSYFDLFGIKADDLSLNYMYWDLIEELEPDSLGLTGVGCRVFLLQNPNDENIKIKVWVSKEYFAPLKMHWFKSGEKDPYKKLTMKSFSDKNGVWFPLKVYMENERGRLSIDFQSSKSDANFYNIQDAPKDLFKMREW